MFKVEVLDRLRIEHDGEPLELAPSERQTLALLVCAGRDGVTFEQLMVLHGGPASVTRDALKGRLRGLAHKGLPVPRPWDSARIFQFAEEQMMVDVWSLRSRLESLPSANFAPADSLQVAESVTDLLLRWRCDPVQLYGLAQGHWLERAQEQLVRLVIRLAENSVLPRYGREFVRCFPDRPELLRLLEPSARGGRLLVVEDQLMDDFRELLDDEFDLLPVENFAEWRQVQAQGLLGVRGAIVDQHLEPLNGELASDSLGLQVVEFLRDNTNIRPVLVSAAFGYNIGTESANLIEKYRLQDVIRKRDVNALDANAIRSAARSVMRPGPQDERLWIERCVRTIQYLVELRFADHGDAGRRAIDQCNVGADSVMRHVRARDLPSAQEELGAFERRWQPQSG